MPEIAIAWRFSSQKVHHWDLGTTWDFTMVFLSEFSGMNSWDLVAPAADTGTAVFEGLLGRGGN